jgi:hypothetical protein
MASLHNPAIQASIAGIYILGGLITFGHLHRSGPATTRRTLVRAAVAVVWPLYWIVIHGVVGAFETLSSAVKSLLFSFLSVVIALLDGIARIVETAYARLLEPVWVAYIIVGLLFPAYYIGQNWAGCTDWGCGAVILRAIAWGIFWPAYLF